MLVLFTLRSLLCADALLYLTSSLFVLLVNSRLNQLTMDLYMMLIHALFRPFRVERRFSCTIERTIGAGVDVRVAVSMHEPKEDFGRNLLN